MAPIRRGEGGRPFPDKSEVKAFLAGFEGRPRTNELLKAFGLKAAARNDMKALIRELERDGVIAPRGGTKRERRKALPPVTVIEITGIDENGDLLAKAKQDPGVSILLPVEALEGTAPAPGDQVLARLDPVAPHRYEARVIKLLPRRPTRIVGTLEVGGDGYWLRPLGRKARLEYRVAPDDRADAEAGDVVAAAIRETRGFGTPSAIVEERLGRLDEPAAISMSAAVEFDLPVEFPPEALAEAGAAAPVSAEGRTDLRALPLVTIDGADARDFDDAVHAEADRASGNRGGFRITVAIADVAHYVRPDGALDLEARKRGNSVYFPDRVIPMLPEALSNDLCSLRPGEDRAALAAIMRIDAQGQLLEARFVRAVIRSRARLTYEEVQAAVEGRPGEQAAPLAHAVIEPLYAAYAVLAEARERRGALELDLPERKVEIGPDGKVTGIGRRERLASHMLIEEFMILANVASARLMSERGAPALYRVHDKPDPVRLAALADYLERLGIPWSRTAGRPADFTALIRRLKDHELSEAVSSFVLRSQAQAVYSPKNIGHFGLALERYCHFTSPIRRYSDLALHRAIIGLLGLGEGGECQRPEPGELEELGRLLSQAERRAMEAERAVVQRQIALFLSVSVGARFAGKVTGVQNFGLFVTLEETGAEGLVPVSMLGDDVFLFDGGHHALVGRRTGETFGLGDRVVATLIEAEAATGSLVLQIEEHERAHGAELARRTWARAGPQHRGKPERRGPPARRGRSRRR